MTLSSRHPAALRSRFVGLAAAIAIVAPACSDDGAAAEEQAAWTLTQIHPLVGRDVAQVTNGLPRGAELLAEHLPEDPGADPAELQRRIKAARENVENLAFSKGTFFAYATPEGLVLRSEADPDRLVEKNVLGAFPELKKALEPGAGVVTTTGEMPEMRGVRTGPDTTFVAAHAVPATKPPAKGPAEGEPAAAAPAASGPRGLFITGWSYRAYAFYLEEAARRALADEAKKQEKSRAPVSYVYLAREGQVYGAPVTPEVNAEAIARADLTGKSASGPYRGRLEITGRPFGVAAQRLPELGGDTTLVVLATVY